MRLKLDKASLFFTHIRWIQQLVEVNDFVSLWRHIDEIASGTGNTVWVSILSFGGVWTTKNRLVTLFFASLTDNGVRRMNILVFLTLFWKRNSPYNEYQKLSILLTPIFSEKVLVLIKKKLRKSYRKGGILGRIIAMPYEQLHRHLRIPQVAVIFFITREKDKEVRAPVVHEETPANMIVHTHTYTHLGTYVYICRLFIYIRATRLVYRE